MRILSASASMLVRHRHSRPREIEPGLDVRPRPRLRGGAARDRMDAPADPSVRRSLAHSVLTGAAIVGCALLWRLVSAFTGFFSNVVFPQATPDQLTVTGRPHLFWDALARWDSGWYFGIARNGYEYVEAGRNNLAFFPTYPVSMGYLGYWMGGGQANYYYAGIIISWAAFAAAMVTLYRLARLDLDRDAAARACIYAAVFPFAFFYGMVYPSSLFLFLSVLTFYCFRRGWWVAAAISGALVTCTRVNGILIWPALAIVVFTQWRHAPRPQLRAAIVTLCLVPAGLVAYSVFSYMLSGSFVEYANSIRRWDYHPGGAPWTVFTTLIANLRHPYEYLTTNRMAPYDLLNGLTAVGAIAAVPFVWRRFGAAYAMLMVANLALPLSSGQFEGLGRYTAVLFPLMLWLATFRNTLVQAAILCGFGMLYMLCQSLFVNVHPLF